MGEAALTAAATVTKLDVEGTAFPAFVTPPGSSKTHFLAGAGVRGLEIGGKFIVFTAIGVYLETDAVPAIAAKWKCKGADELADSVDFFRDVYSGPFEKFSRVSMVLPLTGQQYSEKVAENCVAQWTAAGSYTDAEATAIGKFKEVFRSENFMPGSSILFTHSPNGSLKVAFSKDGLIPGAAAAEIVNKALAEAILESVIGEHGVSPAAKRSLARRPCVRLVTSFPTLLTVRQSDVWIERYCLPKFVSQICFCLCANQFAVCSLCAKKSAIIEFFSKESRVWLDGIDDALEDEDSDDLAVQMALSLTMKALTTLSLKTKLRLRCLDHM